MRGMQFEELWPERDVRHQSYVLGAKSRHRASAHMQGRVCDLPNSCMAESEPTTPEFVEWEIPPDIITVKQHAPGNNTHHRQHHIYQTTTYVRQQNTPDKHIHYTSDVSFTTSTVSGVSNRSISNQR